MNFPHGVRPNPVQCLSILVRRVGLIPMVHLLISPPLVEKLFLSPTCRILVNKALNSLCSPVQLPIIMHAPLLCRPSLTMPLVPFPLHIYPVTSRWPCTRVLLIPPFRLTWISRATRLPTTHPQHLVPQVLVLGISLSLISPVLLRQHKLKRLVCVLLKAESQVPKVLGLALGSNPLELRFKYLRKLARRPPATNLHPPNFLCLPLS